MKGIQKNLRINVQKIVAQDTLAKDLLLADSRLGNQPASYAASSSSFKTLFCALAVLISPYIQTAENQSSTPVTTQAAQPIQTATSKAAEQEIIKSLDAYIAAQARVREAEEKNYSAIEQQRLKDIAEAARLNVKKTWGRLGSAVNYFSAAFKNRIPWLVRMGGLSIAAASAFYWLAPTYSLISGANIALGSTLFQHLGTGTAILTETGIIGRGPTPQDEASANREWEAIINPKIPLPPIKERRVPQFKTFLEAQESYVLAFEKRAFAQLESDKTYGINPYGDKQQKLAIAKEQFALVSKEAIDTIYSIVQKIIDNKDLQNLAMNLQVFKIDLRITQVSISAAIKRFNELYNVSKIRRFRSNEFIKEPRKEYMAAVELQKAIRALIPSINAASLSESDQKIYISLMKERQVTEAFGKKVLDELNAFQTLMDKERGLSKE